MGFEQLMGLTQGQRCSISSQGHMLLGIFYTGGDNKHFAVYTRPQRALVLVTNAFVCLLISTIFVRINVLGECGIDSSAAALDNITSVPEESMQDKNCMSGFEMWAGLMFSKFMYQFFLGKYLVEFLLQNFTSAGCNYAAYFISAISIVACLALFSSGVEPESREEAVEKASILFAIDIIVMETITGYFLTYIACVNKLRVPTETPKEKKTILGRMKKAVV